MSARDREIARLLLVACSNHPTSSITKPIVDVETQLHCKAKGFAHFRSSRLTLASTASILPAINLLAFLVTDASGCTNLELEICYPLGLLGRKTPGTPHDNGIAYLVARLWYQYG